MVLFLITLFAISIMVFFVLLDVLEVLTTSTNFIIGTGFIKCMPIILSGLFVFDAISAIDIDTELDFQIIEYIMDKNKSDNLITNIK